MLLKGRKNLHQDHLVLTSHTAPCAPGPSANWPISLSAGVAPASSLLRSNFRCFGNILTSEGCGFHGWSMYELGRTYTFETSRACLQSPFFSRELFSQCKVSIYYHQFPAFWCSDIQRHITGISCTVSHTIVRLVYFLVLFPIESEMPPWTTSY